MRKNFLILACFAFMLLPMRAQEAKQTVGEAFAPFDVGEIKPKGWLHDWAGMASRGLTKKLGDDFTEFVKGWQTADAPGWWHYEQTGYYADGVTRLGFILDDTLLMNRSKRVMEAVMARQKHNGYILSNNKDYIEKWGSADGDYGMYWSEAVFCRAALAYYSATHDEKVLSMLKNVYDEFPLFERKNTGKPLNGGELDNMRRIVGLENMLEISRYSGERCFADRAMKVFENYENAYLDSWVRNENFMRTAICHGVSYNETAKLCAAAYIWNANPDYLAASVNAYEFLQEHFVLPLGVNSSNEYLHGIGAFEAAEACDISDFLWSNVWMARATGKAKYGDRIEKDFFNALPTAVNSYFDLSLYTTAMNRVPGVHLKVRDDGQYYKVIHDPTCCSANINRVLPNFVVNMCMTNQKDELMWLLYAPSHLKTKDGKFDVEMQTEYPFRESIKLIINAMPKDEVLLLRVPEWCKNPTCSINGKMLKTNPVDGFYRIERKWNSGDVVELTFPMRLRLETGVEQFADFNGIQPYWGIMEPSNDDYEYSGFAKGGDYAVVNFGPMVFAVCLQERDASYYELNEERWHEFRYALDDKSLNNSQIMFRDLPPYFRWSKDNAPITISVKASLIDWEPDKGDPKLPLEKPKVIRNDIDLQLIPIGCAPFRMAMFPFLH